MKKLKIVLAIVSTFCMVLTACKDNQLLQAAGNGEKAYISFSDVGLSRASSGMPDYFFQTEELEESDVTNLVFKAINSSAEAVIDLSFKPDEENEKTAIEVFKSYVFELEPDSYTFTVDIYALDITSTESSSPVMTGSIQNLSVKAGNTYNLPFTAKYTQFSDLQIKYYWEPDIIGDFEKNHIGFVQIGLFSMDDLTSPIEGTVQNCVPFFDEESGTYSVTYTKTHIPRKNYFLKAFCYLSYDSENEEPIELLGQFQSYVTVYGYRINDERHITSSEYGKRYPINYDLKGGIWGEEDAWHKHVDTFDPDIQKQLTSTGLVYADVTIDGKEIPWRPHTSWYDSKTDEAVSITPLITEDGTYQGGEYNVYAKWNLHYRFKYNLEETDGSYSAYSNVGDTSTAIKKWSCDEVITDEDEFNSLLYEIADTDFNSDDLPAGYENCTEDYVSWDIGNISGSLYVFIYYKCNRINVTNTYIFNAKDDDESFQNELTLTGKYGTQIDYDTDFSVPEYTGYKFTGWQKKNENGVFEPCDLPLTFDSEAATYYAVYEPTTSSGITINPEESNTKDYAKFVSLSSSESLYFDEMNYTYGDDDMVQQYRCPALIITADTSNLELPNDATVSSYKWFVEGNYYPSFFGKYEITDENLEPASASLHYEGETVRTRFTLTPKVEPEDEDCDMDYSGKTLYLDIEDIDSDTKIDVTLMFEVGGKSYSVSLTLMIPEKLNWLPSY